MIQNLSAIVQHAINPGNRDWQRFRPIILLPIHKHNDRDAG